MPEGDTIRNVAAFLGPRVVGQEIVAAHSRWPSACFALAGRAITRLEPVGKNLWFVLDDRTAIRVHLGLRGRWRWIERPFSGSVGSVSLALTFAAGAAVCTGAPRVERLPAKWLDAPSVDEGPAHPVRRLGPDVLGDTFDPEEVLPRIRRCGATAAVDVLRDQRVACGIGNVYASEVLFVRGVDPFADPASLGDEAWRGLYAEARARMSANLASGDAADGPRVTAPGTGHRHWVYGREGRPCLRCHTPIEARTTGADLPRRTWWCPQCQRG
ncbi:MAG: DNA-formamidopyrimidine glycosylase family protein [Myxococcota bacterium]